MPSWSQSAEMNGGSQSEVISLGTPDLEIHSRKSIWAHAGAIKLAMGIASAQQVNLADNGEEIS